MKHWTIAALVVAAALSVAACEEEPSAAPPPPTEAVTEAATPEAETPTQAPSPTQTTPARPEPTPSQAPSPLTYTVKAGDVCWRIAEEHGVTTQALMEANPRIDANCSNLGVGWELIIPGASATGAVASPSPEATSSPPLTWSGLEVAAENRCAPYDADDYPYSQSVEQLIVGDMGGIIYGPYTGTWFASTSETDIEHIVARSEAHDSGLCAAGAATRRRFASDILNLTLASPSVNRSQKSGKDAAEWLPDLNRCWFASRVVEVRLKYALTVDERERDAIEGILSGCSSTAMIVDTSGQAATATPVPAAAAEGGALELYDDNGNGRITCAEARRHGIAPVSRGHPAYPHMDDRDGDGVVCE